LRMPVESEPLERYHAELLFKQTLRVIALEDPFTTILMLRRAVCPR
jgi:hypothetical protein